MSNVLIGIIGVILFIGLALAGALFLGSRFQEATASSTASALVQMAQQTTHAIAMRQVTTGSKQITDGFVAVSLATDGYMRSVPYNPTAVLGQTGDPSLPLRAVKDDLSYGVAGGGAEARLVIAKIGDQSAPPERICQNIQRNLGRPDYPVVTSTAPDDAVGCFKAGPAITGAVSANSFYVYSRI